MEKPRKVYDEELGQYLVPIEDWLELIADMRAKGKTKFSRNAIRCAESWNRCYVGKKHEQLPDVVKYYKDTIHPIDNKLSDLGSLFGAAVEDHNLDLAEDLAHQIDDRVLVLKRRAK